MTRISLKLIFSVNDKVTEYPKTINVLKRFNLYPELAVGTAKRIFDIPHIALAQFSLFDEEKMDENDTFYPWALLYAS